MRNLTFFGGNIPKISNIQMVKNLLETALSRTVFEMTFSISAIIQDGGQNSGNSTFFTGTISKVSSKQRVQILLEITLSLRVFEINEIFNFGQYSIW